MSQKILIDPSAIKTVLSFFGKSTDEGQFIIESDTKKRVLSFDGTEVCLKNFGGIMIGSEVYIKSDIDSVIKFLEKTSNV